MWACLGFAAGGNDDSILAQDESGRPQPFPGQNYRALGNHAALAAGPLEEYFTRDPRIPEVAPDGDPQAVLRLQRGSPGGLLCQGLAILGFVDEETLLRLQGRILFVPFPGAKKLSDRRAKRLHEGSGFGRWTG